MKDIITLYCDCGFQFVEGSLPESETRRKEIGIAPNPFRPTWISVTIALIVAVPLQIGGFFLGIMNSCFDCGSDCAAYSAVGTAIAKAMAWPVFVVENFTRGTHADDYLWWFSTPLQWAYCYLLLAIGRAAVHTFREANGR